MKKPLETILYSAAGVLVLFMALVVFNFVAGRFHTRVDLTADKAFTLSKGTRDILAKLDTPVKIRFYCSRGQVMPVLLRPYAQTVEDLLDEYRQASKGKIQIEKINPEPDSDAEDAARLDGVEGQPMQNGETVYLGLSVNMLDQKQAIPFLDPGREKLLEYDITRAISEVIDNKKPVVGIMSPLAVTGGGMAAMMQGEQGKPAWVLYSELQDDYQVKTVDMNATSIPDDVNVLVVIHPRGITPAGECAIDQFIMRGGKLIAFLDPAAALDSPPGGFMPTASSSSLPILLKAWGLNFDTSHMIEDMDNIARTQKGPVPGLMLLTGDSLSKDDLVTADVPDVLMAFPGAFDGTPVAGLKETVLAKTSKNSGFGNAMTSEMSPQEAINSFVSENKEFPVAIRLTGKFKTAFPDGAPKADDAPKPDDTPKPDDAKKDDKTPAASLKETAGDNSVILVGDSDMMQDTFTVQPADDQGRSVVIPSSGNLAFAENAVEQLTGDSDLIAIRSRTTRERPFTVVEKMEQSAEANYQKKEKEIQASISDLEAKLNDLQQHRGDSEQTNILTPEQKAEFLKAKEEVASKKKEEHQIEHQLKSATNSLQTRLMLLNVALMPFLVALIGIAVAVFKRIRTAAQ